MGVQFNIPSIFFVMSVKDFVKKFYPMNNFAFYCNGSSGVISDLANMETVNKIELGASILYTTDTFMSEYLTINGIRVDYNTDIVLVPHDTSLTSCILIAKYIVEQEGFKMED